MKKGVELSINVIIIAAIAIVVLIVIFVFFTNRMTDTNIKLEGELCSDVGGQVRTIDHGCCKSGARSDCGSAEEMQVWAKIGNGPGELGPGQICCINKP